MAGVRWDDLEIFLAVARAGTLVAASSELGRSPPTLHRRVAALEQALGGPLFVKAPRGYSLTPLGEALLPHAEMVAEDVHRLTRAATGHDRQASGPIHIAITADLVSVLAPHLSRLREECVGIEPVLHISDRFVDLGRETDVALRVSARAPDEAIAHRVGTSLWCRYASTGDPDLPWVLYEGRDTLAAVRWRRRVHPGAPHLARVDDLQAMLALLRRWPAQGLLPLHVGDSDPDLVRIGDPIPETETPIWLLVHVDLRRSARVRAFLDVVLSPLTDQLARAPAS